MTTLFNEPNLPGFEQLGFPDIMQDETLYGWCARFHHLAMRLDARVTSQILFGSPSAGLHHDIPCNLKSFENNTQSYLGTSENLLYRYTPFGFYSKFLTQGSVQKIAQLFMSANNATARSKLGLNQSDLTTSKVLKLCPECSEFQNKTKRFTWWQIGHQLPTSFVCHEHDCALKFLIVPHARGYAKSFYTPSSRLELLALSQYFDDKYYRQQLKKIRSWGDAIWRSDGLQMPDGIMRWCCLYQAQTRGWIGPDGKVMIHDLRNAFVNYYGELLNVFGEEYFHDLTDVNSTFYTQMIRKVSGRQHPVKLVLLINFLFDTFDEFLETYNDVTKDLLQGGDALCRAIVSKKNSVIARMKLNAGQPVEQVALLLGMSASSVSNCADKDAAETRCLPRIIGTDKEKMIKEKLQQGLDYKEIAISTGVRVSYIKQYLAKRPSLKQERQESYHCRQLDLHREQFLTTLKNHPGASLNAIRRVPENGFNWLYANDREWLRSTLPAIWRINF
jgi:predicted transcriptional regulator